MFLAARWENTVRPVVTYRKHGAFRGADGSVGQLLIHVILL